MLLLVAVSAQRSSKETPLAFVNHRLRVTEGAFVIYSSAPLPRVERVMCPVDFCVFQYATTFVPTMGST